jgi:hypothetical protein
MRRYSFLLPAVIAVLVLVTVAACGGSGSNSSVPVSKATPKSSPGSAKAESVADKAAAAVAQIHTLTPLQQATNTCLAAIADNFRGQTDSAALTAALSQLIGKRADDVVSIGSFITDTRANTVQIVYNFKNGHSANATFDSGRIIFAILGFIPEFKVFGILGDPAIYCTEAAFWLTGNVGGQIGTLLRPLFLPHATEAASIEGTWNLQRSAATVCINFPGGCKDSPIAIRFGQCTAAQCAMSRTDGIWRASHAIDRQGATWTATFTDIAIACHGQANPAQISIVLTVTSTRMRAGTLIASSLGGTYGVKAATNPPNCDSNASGLEAMYGKR